MCCVILCRRPDVVVAVFRRGRSRLRDFRVEQGVMVCPFWRCRVVLAS